MPIGGIKVKQNFYITESKFLHYFIKVFSLFFKVTMRLIAPNISILKTVGKKKYKSLVLFIYFKEGKGINE